jgi:hypothetical protein
MVNIEMYTYLIIIMFVKFILQKCIIKPFPRILPKYLNCCILKLSFDQTEIFPFPENYEYHEKKKFCIT